MTRVYTDDINAVSQLQNQSLSVNLCKSEVFFSIHKCSYHGINPRKTYSNASEHAMNEMESFYFYCERVVVHVANAIIFDCPIQTYSIPETCRLYESMVG